MNFICGGLFGEEILTENSIAENDKPKKPKKSKKPTGCEACPLNLVPGVNKIIGEVTGKKIMIWAQSPGADENRAKRELVGKAGQWLWKELLRVGIRREDCDIQNVVRCYPADLMMESLYMRDPAKEELKCCKVHTKAALEKQKAKIWLVFGRVAAMQLFGKTQSTHRIFTHENGVRVFILDHPSFFLRGGSDDRLRLFRKTLDVAKQVLLKPPFYFIEERKTEIVTSGRRAIDAAKLLLAVAAKTNTPIAYDEEDDIIDGEHRLLCVGACASVLPEVTKVFVLDHPENTASEADRDIIRRVVAGLLQHKHAKVLQHGVHDDNTFYKLLGVQVNGFDWDTQYGDYMYDPSNRSYSLTSIVNRRYPEHTDYKEYVSEAAPEGMTVEDARDTGEFHLANAPLRKVTLYNGMDCYETRRIWGDIHEYVPTPMVRVYTHAQFVLDRMENFGPLFDPLQAARLMDIFPQEKESYVAEIRRLSKEPGLNLNSPKQMQKVLYETWGITPLNDKKSTDKETLALLRPKNHPGIKALNDYRAVKNKIERIEAFDRSAKAHLGRVVTIWWLTGTRTGRLSSGGGTRPDKENLGNLQNIPKETNVMNMLISDLAWRDFYAKASIGMKKTVTEINGVKEELWVPDERKFTQAFLGYQNMDWFVACDYSQMELRVLGFVTGEREMLEMFSSGIDIHAAIGSLWSRWTIEELVSNGTAENETRRTTVKRFHFGLIYGLTPPGLQQDLLAAGIRVSKTEAEGYYTAYFKRFKRVQQYVNDMPNFARRHGYVENLFGFRIPIEVTEDRGDGSWWMNQAVNAPIQGAAHQVLLCAMALMQRTPEKYELLRPQMEIHDALVEVTPGRELTPTIKLTQQLMERDVMVMIKEDFGINWTVPLQAEPKIGFRFGGLAKVKDPEDPIPAMKAAVAMVPKHQQDLDRLAEKYCVA